MAKENNPDSIGHLFNNFLADEAIAKAVGRYRFAVKGRKGNKQRKRAVQVILDSILNLAKVVSDQEIEIVQEASGRHGVDFLTTDTSGARSVEDLEMMRPFATGIPSRCVVVAVVHPEVGIGASHKITANNAFLKRFIERNIVDQNFQEKLAAMSRSKQDLLATPPASLKQTVSQAFNQAVIEFRDLIPGDPLPKENLNILVAGMSFLEDNKIADVEEAMQGIIGRNVHFNDGMILGRSRKINLQTRIGKEEGVIWGGPNHQELNEPVFYAFK